MGPDGMGVLQGGRWNLSFQGGPQHPRSLYSQICGGGNRRKSPHCLRPFWSCLPSWTTSPRTLTTLTIAARFTPDIPLFGGPLRHGPGN